MQPLAVPLNIGILSGLASIMRPRQWVKNSFVVAPLVFSGQLSHGMSISKTVVAFLLFCIASSASYILNDIHDIELDKRHPIKSMHRPLASGAISMSCACMLLIVCYGLLVSAWWVVPSVFYVLLGYLSLNIVYTLALKNQPVLDLFIIAFGFVFRVYAGAIAINVPVSSWMLITTLCLALYLAAIKRRQELTQHGCEGRKVLNQYSISLVNRYAEMSATCAVVFYSMFVMSARPGLVITIPIVLFGLFRYWYVVETLDGGESPVDVVLFDKPLFIGILLWIVVSIFVIYGKTNFY